jgi:hypothetical protein
MFDRAQRRGCRTCRTCQQNWITVSTIENDPTRCGGQWSRARASDGLKSWLLPARNGHRGNCPATSYFVVAAQRQCGSRRATRASPSPSRRREAMKDVVQRLLTRVCAFGIKMRLLLPDFSFYRKRSRRIALVRIPRHAHGCRESARRYPRNRYCQPSPASWSS